MPVGSSPTELSETSCRRLARWPADIGQSGDESWHVLADPEGNEFCCYFPGYEVSTAHIARLAQALV